MIGCAHCLFEHLALIHVSGGLVIVREGNSRGDHRKNIYRINLLVGGIASDVLF